MDAGALINLHWKTMQAQSLFVRCALVICAVSCLAGCALSPSLPVVGAYFPGWLFCMVGGLVLTVIVRAVLIRMRRERALGPPVVVYSLLYAVFCLLMWLLFF